MCEPLRGWRHVTVTDRRTRQDYAHCIRDLVDRQYPRATKIRLVQDNLNTHDGASLYETFRPEEARRILDKIEFHYTPKPGPERTLSKLGNLGTCALIGLFVYRSLCCYIHGGARRTTDGGHSARFFG